MCVCDQLASPASTSLFRAAIEESGPCQGQAPQSDVEQASIRWAAERGCPDRPGVAACLRGLPVARTSPAPKYPPKAASFAGPVYRAPEYAYEFIDGARDRLDGAQRRLSHRMINYWAQFVNTGTVNVDNQPARPRYAEGARVLSLAPDNTTLIDNFSADHHFAADDHPPR